MSTEKEVLKYFQFQYSQNQQFHSGPLDVDLISIH